jgi:hypothetical protein
MGIFDIGLLHTGSLEQVRQSWNFTFGHAFKSCFGQDITYVVVLLLAVILKIVPCVSLNVSTYR